MNSRARPQVAAAVPREPASATAAHRLSDHSGRRSVLARMSDHFSLVGKSLPQSIAGGAPFVEKLPSYAVAFALQFVRVNREEAILLLDRIYRDYSKAGPCRRHVLMPRAPIGSAISQAPRSESQAIPMQELKQPISIRVRTVAIRICVGDRWADRIRGAGGALKILTDRIQATVELTHSPPTKMLSDRACMREISNDQSQVPFVQSPAQTPPHEA